MEYGSPVLRYGLWRRKNAHGLCRPSELLAEAAAICTWGSFAPLSDKFPFRKKNKKSLQKYIF